jgi:hypothetical protein
MLSQRKEFFFFGNCWIDRTGSQQHAVTLARPSGWRLALQLTAALEKVSYPTRELRNQVRVDEPVPSGLQTS